MQMNHQTYSVPKLSVLVLLAIVLVALNLRPVMAVISPILDQLQLATAMDDRLAGLLTTLPVMVMGLFALAGIAIQQYVSERQGVVIGLVLIALACISRYWFGSSMALLGSAVVAGMGIALIQVLIPSFIKTCAPARAGSVMGFYTTAIMSGAAIAAALSAPLSHLLGWQHALAALGLPAILAMLVWRKVTAKLPVAVHTGSIQLPFKSARAWLLMLFFGIGTGAFTLVLAWFPPYFTQLGWSASQAGLLLSALTLCEVIAGLLISANIHRFPDRRVLLWFILALQLLGLLALVYYPVKLVWLAVAGIGFGIGALFPLALIVAMDHVKSPREAGALLGFVQGGGYMIASLMPLLAGIIRAHSSSLVQAWLLMAAGVVLLMLMALRLKPGSSLYPS